MTRVDGRTFDQLRSIKITEGFVPSAMGSYLIEVGRTRVLCNGTLDEEIPRWLKGKGKGWVTAEYSLLPQSTGERVKRERNSVSGRTQEIQRLIGRSLRAACHLEHLPERQIIIDCDVLEADGGTRTASIVGAFLALGKVLTKTKEKLNLQKPILKNYVSAVSVGLLNNQALLDLCYKEDSEAEVDMNIVMADTEQFIEIQGTGEEAIFSRDQLNDLLNLAAKGCLEIQAIQKSFLPELV